MRTILLNFMLKAGEGVTIPEEASRKLIAWADENQIRRENAHKETSKNRRRKSLKNSGL
jgi:hypothetical protein